MKTDLKQLDDLCMRFEGLWNADRPVSLPFSFFASESPRFGEPSEIICELCMIDLQRHWQAWNSQDLGSMSLADIAEAQSRIPNSKDYLSTAQNLGFLLGESDEVDLKSCEFAARQKYGDLPYPAEAGLGVQPICAEKIKRPSVAINRSGKPIFESSVWGKVKAGRQSRGEPDSPCLFADEIPAKLICTSGSDPSISRNQFVFSLVSARFAMITNTSTNRSFSVSNRIPLTPNSSEILRLPITIELGETAILFERNKKHNVGQA